MNLPTIKIKAITLFNWAVMGVLITLSIWLWLPIVVCKVGLLISDHVMKYIKDA